MQSGLVMKILLCFNEKLIIQNYPDTIVRVKYIQSLRLSLHYLILYLTFDETFSKTSKIHNVLALKNLFGPFHLHGIKFLRNHVKMDSKKDYIKSEE